MASPAVGRLRTGRPGETKAQPKLVDALAGASADAGSIPAASTFRRQRDCRDRYGDSLATNASKLPALVWPESVHSVDPDM